tara:strand:- start:140311 stop:140547 length:237 start_codon:yes stop_codon:yes gene_type:complete
MLLISKRCPPLKNYAPVLSSKSHICLFASAAIALLVEKGDSAGDTPKLDLIPLLPSIQGAFLADWADLVFSRFHISTS